MASGEETDALKVYWDHFFKAETGTYEKSTWLDLFLAEFLMRVNEGANPKELIHFCPVSGVVTLVGCELLCGIHRVTSSINTHYSVSMPCLDPSPILTHLTCFFHIHNYCHARSSVLKAPDITLRYYTINLIMEGVSWPSTTSASIHFCIGLSCCRQLSSVLIWLFGELSSASSGQQVQGGRVPSPCGKLSPSRLPIYQLFSHKIWSKQTASAGIASKVNSAASSDRGSVTGRSRRLSQNKLDTETKPKRKLTKHSDSSDSGDTNDDLQILNRSLTIKVTNPNDDFEYFNSSIRSSNDYPNESIYDPFYSPRKIKPKADDHMNEKHRAIINSEITTFEFILLITNLLQELCKAESSLSGAEGSQISMQCINFSLRNLCSLQFSSLPHNENSIEGAEIKVALTELLIVSLDKVLVHSDLCAKLINNGILPMLLRILEDIISKRKNRAKDVILIESQHLLKFVFGIAYSITAFFHCLLMQCRTVDKLREFTDQFKLYGDCLKGGLLVECIELMIRIPGENKEEITTLIKKLIESIGKLICGMKRVRSEVIHSAACPRTRHKVCRQRVAAGMHHHHDILGEASTDLPMSSACCVSVLYGTLTSLLTDDEVTAESMLRNKILRVMLNYGVCCCFSPGFLMESIVRLMLMHNNVAPLCLQLLEHTVYGDLGASVLVPKVTDQLPCSICEPSEEQKELRKYCPHGVSTVDRKSVCSFLIHYNSLLQLDNHNNVLHATVSHLLRITPKCRMEMKYELLFSVIYPTFIVSKHRYIIRMEDTAYFLTVSCLNIFASLLNTVPFAEQFIQKGGLSYVLELVSLPEFSSQCCSILEIAIIVEIFKLMKENSELTYFREISSLSSVQMLFKSLSNVTEKFYKIYKTKLPAGIYEELCDLSNEKESLGLSESEARKASAPQQIKTAFGANVESDCLNDLAKTLKNIWNFWKTCASLCLYSPMFREYMVSESVFLDSYSLLKMSLYYLCNCEYGVMEMRILIKIVEALLTVQLSVADVTGARSKETSCRLVRAALSSLGAVFEGGGGLRALCESLIRVATAHPSRRHSMPRVAHGKVPPLVCPPGGSSAEGSSSEESAAAPYASEHSDPTPARPDEGYEADVEVSKLDIPTSYRPRKMSETVAPTSGLQPPAEELASAECAEYAKSGELAHPELCIIVVDILTQLINKLLKSKPSGAGVGDEEDMTSVGHDEESVAAMKRVGGQLARACCARLAGAVGRANAAPPLLLHRLLAPAAAAPDLLARRDLHLEGCALLGLHHDPNYLQRSILELIHVLASQSISASELAAFLKLFTSERPPLKMLLTSLQRLVAAASCNTPDCILTFPELSHLVVNSATSQSHLAESYAKKLQDAHMRAGIRSPWSCGAVRCGVEGAGWAPWLQGFALLLWIHTQPQAPAHHRNDHNWEDKDEFQEDSSDAEATKKRSPPRKEAPSRPAELAHVMSVGHESLMFELWLDTATGVFTIRLSRPEATCNRLVSETRVCSGMPPRAWNCVALNVSERVHKRHIFIEVTLYVNGFECDAVSLPVQGILVRKVTPTVVVVGHAGRRPPAGAYHLSHANVYRAPLLTAHTALHLTAHGPDHACLVYEMSTSTLRELHDNLLLTFGAHAPNIMNLYHQTTALQTVFAGRVSGPGGLMSMPAVGPPPPPAAGAPIPETLFPAWRGAPLPSRHRGLAPALYLLGGPDMLMFLYARVVELKGTAEEQAMALGVLLRACRVDNRLYAMLYSDDTLDMLLTVFAAPDCKATHHLLEVVINEACSAPILSICGDSVVVSARSDAVLLEPDLLVLLTRAWRHLDAKEIRWEVDAGGCRRVERGCCWALLLRCVGELLGHGHPRRAFNHYQMTRRGLLTHLLLACKERFLNSECGPLDPSASSTLVEVVRGLMGTPPLLHKVALLCDFLLLMHQASDTFVTHSRANFYFLLTPESQEMSEFASSSKRKPSKRTKRKADLDMPSVSSTSTDDNEGLPMKEMGQREEDRMDSSFESTKQMKGLINMQIKEGRRMSLQAVCGPISAESLLVLGNHKQACVRAALVRVVAALQRRAPPDLARRLRHQHYYLHLANQISLYEGSWELATACAALLTKCDVPLEDQLDDDIWLDMTEEAMQRCPPLLALLPGCLRDVPLAHNITLIIRRIIDKASLKMLSEVAVAEVAVRCVRALGQAGDVFEGRELLLEDLHELLNRLALKALAQHHTMQSVCELHYMLSFVELSSAEGGVRRAARDAQVALYVAQLDYLEERLHANYTANTRYANYFTTVLSSAVSLGGEGAARSERGELGARHFATATRARARWWAGVGSGAEWAAPLQELVWWAAAPAPGVRAAQPRLLRALYHAPPAAVHMLTPPDPGSQRKLAVYVLSMIARIHAEAEAGPPPVELAITDWARGWALASQAALPERLDAHALPAEAQRHALADRARRAAAAAAQRAPLAKVVFGKEALSGKVTETAMCVTRAVVEAQNGERKAFMEHLRREHARHSHRAARWQRLLDAHTHEQGKSLPLCVWHDPSSYPTSWQLDATEGPGRVRVRLRRAHLHIAPRFLKPHVRYKTEIRVLEIHLLFFHKMTCALLWSPRCIHFVPEEARGDGGGGGECCEGEEACEAQSWPLEEVQQVATRRWCLQERALELFLGCGRAILLAFATQLERTAFLKALDDAHLPATVEPDSLQEAMSQWRSGAITNWEYLMRLNGLAGRSYNDLMQYPVLPFVIADYTSRILDLTDPKSFRDLSKPMAVQNKNREQHYINVYNELKAARREGCSPLLCRQPHHYASLYSNSGAVLHYLVRVPPYTTQFLNYQDNNFDMPDRTFHSLATTWRLITNDSPTDVKELIPELFYLPELFHNNEDLNLGVRQCGLGVDSVELPPWAADARLFTLVHRQALEAPPVTDALPHWIDLVFGYKQTGQPAIDAVNVFPACTYYGFDPLALEDEVDRTAAADMVRTYGQAPRQLLRTPHPQRQPDLAHHQQHQTPVWDGVVGASWGRYCGSPALGAPEVAARRACAGAAALHALPNPRAVAVATRATALMALHGEAAAGGAGREGQRAALALASWGHSDGVMRLKRRRDARPDLLLHTPPRDQITKVASSCSSGGCPYPLVVGFASGRVLAVRVRTAAGAAPRVLTRTLHAHAHPVTDAYLCPRAGLLATASGDGLIVLWDLNTLSYIRTLPNRDMIPVTHVTISATLCDVATVHDAAAPARGAPAPGDDPPAPGAGAEADAYEKDAMLRYKSLIRVHTVNASFVGSVRVSERVTCVCYSGGAEGVSANCVAAGLASGGVRLYSALCYGSDSQLLYGCYADGVVVAWEGGRSRGSPPRIHPAHALL
ncbi:hypothetical protein K1T71_008541 [Dendrolimus kikuchii]|uniref:Uncharacterized protein n=1 Tax=Dendrolimus kikuchii TaxID=765133 RepID=A0ACC1CUY0_9NEOP|nr:hypothetical protein K1T71_008541 [Dendrolimus kikuchii]